MVRSSPTRHRDFVVVSFIVSTLLACTNTPADTSGTGDSGTTVPMDGLCRVEETPYKGDDKALIAELDDMVAALGTYTLIHWKEHLHDGSDSSIQITVTDVGDPVVATWVEVPYEDWGKYDDLETCDGPWIEVPFTADVAIGGDQAVGTLTSAAGGTLKGSRDYATMETKALSFNKDWQALVDAQTADKTQWQGGPVQEHLSLSGGGISIWGSSPSVDRTFWYGAME